MNGARPGHYAACRGLRNDTVERSSQLLHDGTLKSLLLRTV